MRSSGKIRDDVLERCVGLGHAQHVDELLAEDLVGVHSSLA